MDRAREPSDVASAYDRWAETYDADSNVTRDLAARFLRWIRLVPRGAAVLELGCGTGKNTEWLLDQGAASVIGLDFSAGMLVQASRLTSPRGQFLRHDIRQRWPCADASMDLVLDSLVLEHIADVKPIFHEAARVLRPGGEMVVCELHPARQMHGRQAEFTDPETSERMRIPAFLHDVSEYVNAALQAGLQLLGMEEWRDTPEKPGSILPRLIGFHFQLPQRAPAGQPRCQS